MEITKLVFKDDHIHAEFLLYSDNQVVGKMDISVANGKLRVYHTEVDPADKGKGFANILLENLVSFAIEHEYRIIPICPFVLSQFKKYPEKYASVRLKKST